MRNGVGHSFFLFIHLRLMMVILVALELSYSLWLFFS
jgi:hypothetical protein